MRLEEGPLTPLEKGLKVPPPLHTQKMAGFVVPTDGEDWRASVWDVVGRHQRKDGSCARFCELGRGRTLSST